MMQCTDTGFQGKRHFEVSSHSKDLLAAFNTLLESKTLCDVSLVACGREFRAHRIVLAANSTYFARMFAGSMSESCSSEVELKGVTQESLSQLLSYCYTSTYCVDGANAMDLLIASNMFHFPNVTDGCCTFLKENLSPENCFDVYCLADLHCLDQLQDFCLNFIKQNFRRVTKSSEFKNAEIGLIKKLFVSDDLNISSEKDVFDALLFWVNHDPSERVKYLAQLLELVRLPQMPPKVLVDFVETDPLIEESDLCMRIVNKSKTYYLFPAEDFNNDNKWLSPREKISDANVYLVGGEVRHEVFDQLEKFSPREDKWTCMSPMSYARDGLGISALDGRIYIAGGFDGKRALCSCEIYNIEKDAWSHTSAMNVPRHACSLVEHQGWLYTLGGSDYSSKEHSSVERYDPIRGNWNHVADLMNKREGLAAAALHGSIYAIGGDNGVAIINTVERFDPRIGQWYRSVSMGYRRRYFGACVLNDKIYVAGGSDFEEDYNSFECFDIRANKWQPLPSMGKRRESLALVAIGSRIVAFGGSCCNKETDTTEVYDPTANDWKPFTPMSRPREGMGAIVVE